MITSANILQGTILIVDDLQANILLLTQILCDAGYESITSTTDPSKVYGLHRNNNYDLILLDLQMPGMDGFEVMEKLQELETSYYPPVMVITAQPDHKLRALKAGARDFISKPFELAEVLARVHNMLEVRLLHKELHEYSTGLEQRVQERTAELLNSYQETIFMMTRAAEYKDVDTGSHVQRISSYARKLAMVLGQDEDFVDRIYFASPMHDIGKIGIPDHILLKQGNFRSDEWEIMKEHATIGQKILGNNRSPYLTMAAEIALNHHECWNGEGYPNGKRSDEIPLSASIVAICDIYDALRSKRPYKPGFGHQKALELIMQGDGHTKPEHFDPVVFAAFIKHHRSFGEIFELFKE